MKEGFVRILSAVSGLLITTVMLAQQAALLPQDPAVQSMVLPNGLSCYVAENESSKGMADFVLVRRDYSGNEKVLSMEDVIVSSGDAVDSTLVGIMRKVEKDGIPADQAVIVCGDVDASSVMTRLRYMSLMIDPSVPSGKPEYVWGGDAEAGLSCHEDTLKGLVTVRCEWKAPRAPVNNTVQSAIYEKALWEFGDVACRWIRRNLRRLEIPVADVSYKRMKYDEGVSHEHFVLEATAAAEDGVRVMREVAAVMAALDAGRVSVNDFLLAEGRYLHSLEMTSGRALRDNGEYVDLCTDAFLFDDVPAAAKERLSYFRSKDVGDEERRDIFAGISSALVDLGTQKYVMAEMPAMIMRSDTLSLPGPGFKQKVRSTRKDQFSDGILWTFDNGFKVIYKKMPTARTLYYSMSLNGGIADIGDLERGEGAYISDYMDCCWISGMKGRDFRNMLELSGMTLNTRVNLHNTVISGQVNDRNASLMMKGLLAVAGSCRPDSTSVRYHVKSENLRNVLRDGSDVRAVIDSLMCPGYRYTSIRTAGGVHQDTFAKAEELFSSLTTRMNDGVLVIVGDMHEADLKKLLQQYVGKFKVKSVASRRPSVQYHTVSGWSSYVVDGDADAAVVAVSGMLPMTASNHFAAEIAAMLLERAVKDELKDRSVSVRLSYARSIYPDERFSIFVTLGGDVAPEDVKLVRKVLAECSEAVDSKVMSACREYVKNAYALQMQTPGYWLRVIPLRHMEGKDFTSGYAAKIDAVSAGQVMNVFRTLEKGAGVEYVIRKK